MTSIIYGRYLFTSLVLILAPQAAWGSEIEVKVVDQDSAKGVESHVIMSRAKEKEKEVPVDRTNDKGELAFTHTCILGDQLFAEPVDGSYYQSERKTCKSSVLLRVKKRELPGDEIVARRRSRIFVEYSDGRSEEYIAEYDSVMNNKNVIVGGREGERCYSVLTFRLDRDVYLLKEGGIWAKDESESFSEALASDRTKIKPWAPCTGRNTRMYRRVQRAGRDQIKHRLNEDMAGLLSRLRGMEGVEKVELRI